MSALDDLLSPENFPPCDPLRGEAVRELAALRADVERLRAVLEAVRALNLEEQIGSNLKDNEYLHLRFIVAPNREWRAIVEALAIFEPPAEIDAALAGREAKT